MGISACASQATRIADILVIGAHRRQVHIEEWRSLARTVWDLVVHLHVDHAYGGIQTELHGGMAAA